MCFDQLASDEYLQLLHFCDERNALCMWFSVANVKKWYKICVFYTLQAINNTFLSI